MYYNKSWDYLSRSEVQHACDFFSALGNWVWTETSIIACTMNNWVGLIFLIQFPTAIQSMYIRLTCGQSRSYLSITDLWPGKYVKLPEFLQCFIIIFLVVLLSLTSKFRQFLIRLGLNWYHQYHIVNKVAD